ncbi:MAG TPA: hypothetical protein VIA45_09605 [Thermoanaerobaculia bacterium]|jgi:hypothetical protein
MQRSPEIAPGPAPGRPARRNVRRAILVLLAAAASCRRAANAPSPQLSPSPPPSPVPTHAAAPSPAATPAAAAAVPERLGLRPAERRAVQDFLARHPELRPPGDADRRETSGETDMHHLYGIYNPYFVRGDLNDDGILDFVMAFVRRDSSPSTPWFTIVVFPGKEDASGAVSFGPETFLERDITLAAGDLSIDRDAVVITPDLDDDTTRRYRWDPARRSYVFVRDDEPDSEPPDLSRT